MAYQRLQEAINIANGVENENDLNDGGYFEAGFIAARTKIVDALIALRDSTQDTKSGVSTALSVDTVAGSLPHQSNSESVPSTSVSEAFEFHEFVGIGAGELGMTPCELCGTLERDPVHADKFRVSEAEDKNSVSGASDCSTSRIPKDIQAVVAEIRKRHRVTGFAFQGQQPPQAQKDIASLLSIIDPLQPERVAAALAAQDTEIARLESEIQAFYDWQLGAGERKAGK